MTNIGFTRQKNVLPEIKDNRKKSLPLLPPKESNTFEQANVKKAAENYLRVRGHIVPGYSQVHSKGSDSETLSEADLTTKRDSKLRTTNVQPHTEKSLLMEKFEFSLKERLLNSAHFSLQVPLFDSNAIEEKGRMKTPHRVDSDKLSKNQSMFNAVFPARKESGRFGSPCDTLVADRNRESIDWLNKIENDSQSDDPHSKLSIKTSKDDINLQKNSNLSKKLKKGALEKKLKQDKLPQNDTITGPLEQLKFLSSPRLSSRVGEKGSSRSKIAKEKYKLDMSESKKIILPLSLEKASDSVILENQQTADSNKIKEASLSVNKTKEDISSMESLKDISRKKISSQNTSLETDDSSSFSNGIFRQGGPMADIVSLVNFDEYRVMYFQTADDSEEKTDEPSTNEETTEESKDETTEESREETAEESREETIEESKEETIEEFKEEPEEEPKDPHTITNATKISSIIAAESPVLKPTADQDEMEDEEFAKEMKLEEEDCIAEPCNEPTWFEDYGIDRKSRKDMKEDIKSEESLEGVLEEIMVTPEEEVTQEVVVETKKKKKRKTRPKTVQGEHEETEEAPKIDEFESETVREIKTIPLVTLDQKERSIVEEKEIPIVEEKERPIVKEKPLTQMPSVYLKKNVGKHLIAGLAQVALLMPSDPVEYLAHWLIRERNKENLLQEFKQFKAEVKEVRKKNIEELRKKLQFDYLQNEALQKYREPLYSVFDSSESELYYRGMEETGRTEEEENMYKTEAENIAK